MPKRKNILNFLKDYHPFDEREAKDLIKITQIIKQHLNIFSRECEKAHLTASALIINLNTGQILLHNHKKIKRWLQFGGHADGNTILSAVAMKEAEEETGLNDLEFFINNHNNLPKPIDIELQLIPALKNIPEHYHLDIRYLLTTQTISIPKPKPNESQELAFFTLEKLEATKQDLDPNLFRLIKKSKELLSFI